MSRLFTKSPGTDKVVVAHNAGLDQLPQRTVMCWVQVATFNSVSLGSRIMSREDEVYLNYLDTGYIYGRCRGSGANAITTTTAKALSAGVWTHLAITYDQALNGLIYPFVNGVAVAASQEPGNAIITDNLDINIGHYYANNNGNVDGRLFDFRIYNSILTPTELLAIVVGGPAVDPQPTHNKCQLTFATDQGAVEPDASGNGNDGVITGASFNLNNPPISVYSVPDCRDYATFPNDSRNVQGTLIYDVPSVDSRTAGVPVDSRTAGAPVDSRVAGIVPINCRTNPPF